MKKEKIKVNLFERVDITDPEYAQKMYDKEKSKFKLKLICTAVALIGSIGGLYCFNSVGAKDFLYNLLGVLWLLGIASVIVAGSFVNLFKFIVKFGKFGYYLAVPFPLDIVCFVFGLAIGFLLCFIFPVIPCVITLYQSWKNLNAAKDYLALYHHNSTNVDIEDNK